MALEVLCQLSIDLASFWPGIPIVSSAGIRVVVLRERTIALGLDILRLRAIVLASGDVRFNSLGSVASHLGLISEHSDVTPGCGMPIGIIVALFRALQAMPLPASPPPVAVGILTG